MDPNENLRQQREEQQVLKAHAKDNPAHNDYPGETCYLCDDALFKIAELAEAMDEWMSKSGFLPDEWKTKRQ
jgi:hypothetical protein